MNHTPKPIKVALIEDSPLLQEILSEIFHDIEGIQLCGTAEDERTALDLLASQPVDLVIVDIELKQGSGIGVLEALKTEPQRYGPPRTVILSNHAHPAMRQRCAKLGIDAFFDKSLEMSLFISYVTSAYLRKSCCIRFDWTA